MDESQRAEKLRDVEKSRESEQQLSLAAKRTQVAKRSFSAVLDARRQGRLLDRSGGEREPQYSRGRVADETAGQIDSAAGEENSRAVRELQKWRKMQDFGSSDDFFNFFG